MNIRQFEYVLAVAEIKNFGLAAEKCNITQSTLSTMIGRFEQEIGIKVFDRKTKPVTITKEGTEVVSQIQRIENEVENLKELAKNLKGELSGELKIGVIPTVAPYLLPEILPEFTLNYPSINFTVSEMTTDVIMDLLEKRELDIGIFAIPLAPNFLKEIPLYNEPFVLYDRRKIPQKDITSLENIDFQKFYLLEDGHCLHTRVGAICKTHREKIKGNKNFDFRAGSIDSLIRFVRINEGATLLPYLSCLDFLPNESSKLSEFKSPIPVRTIGLGVHPHFTKKKLLKDFVTAIKEKITPLIPFETEEIVIPPY